MMRFGVVSTASVGMVEELVGRKLELAALEQFLNEMQRAPAALLLEGESGIGKTAIWRAGIELARARHTQVLSCRPGRSEVNLSFAGLGDLLDGLLEEALPRLPDPQRRAVESALALSNISDRVDRRVLGLAFRSILRWQAATGPVLLAVDDTQWVDAPSARILEFALRRLEDEPIGLLGTIRTTDAAKPILELESVLAAPARTLTVGPLSVGAMHELLRRRLGLTLSRPLVLRLHRMTGGNPFFALEIGRVLAARGLNSPHEQPLPVPETLRELVQARLSDLPRRTRETLLAAASVSQPTVELLTGWAGDEVRVISDLERAVRAGVVELEGEQIRFSHPTLASVQYAEASPAARRRIHAELAPVVSDPEERAWHLACKTTAPDAAVAAALETAALHAGRRGAPEAAADLLEQARRLTPADADEDGRRRLLHASTFHLEAGDTATARTLLEEAADSFPHGPKRAETLRRLAWIRYYQDDVRAAAGLFRRTRNEAKSDAATRAAAELGLAWSIRFENALGAWRHARAAVDFAEQASNPRLAWEADAVLAYLDYLRGRPISAERIAEISSRPIGDEGSRLLRPPPWIVAVVLKHTNRLEEARVRLETVHERALASGDYSSLPDVLFQLAHLEFLAGRWERSIEWANEGYASALQAGQDTGRAALLAIRAFISALYGNFDVARADAEEGLTLAQPAGRLRLLSMLGFLELSLANLDQAERYFREAAKREAAAGIREPAVLRYLPDYIEVLAMQGRLGEAWGLLEPFTKQARKGDLPWSRATAARCRGLVQGAAGDPVAALAAVEESMQHHERLGEPFELGRTLLLRGILERRSKQKRAARASLERALGIFEQLGAAPWVEKARAELSRIGGRVAQPGELTPTERRVAALVAEGRTNKEVAAELFVSVKAVEANLSSVYAKLGIRSRTELARCLAADVGRQRLGIS